MGPRNLLAAAALAAALSACKTGPDILQSNDITTEAIPPMTAAEVRIYLQNSTLQHEGDERVWHVFLTEDGRLIGHSQVKETGAVERATGAWEVLSDGQICRQWDSHWGGGDQGCGYVRRERDVYIFTGQDADGGEVSVRRTRLAGNPMNL